VNAFHEVWAFDVKPGYDPDIIHVLLMLDVGQATNIGAGECLSRGSGL
jgi:hypothetical protein